MALSSPIHPDQDSGGAVRARPVLAQSRSLRVHILLLLLLLLCAGLRRLDLPPIWKDTPSGSSLDSDLKMLLHPFHSKMR